jgi:hypothetical protein
MSYLYLLVAADGSTFKIGVSENPTQRMSGLPEDFDRQLSIQFKCDEQEVYKAEKALHFLFRKHHVVKSFGAGYTEWFSINCFDDVKTFIHSNQALLGWTEYEPIPEQIPVAKAPSGYYALSKEEREQRREENRRIRLQACIDNNTNCLSFISNWINTLASASALIGRFTAVDGKQWLAVSSDGVDQHTAGVVLAETVMQHLNGAFSVFGAFEGGGDCPLVFVRLEVDASEVEQYDRRGIAVPLAADLLHLLDGIPQLQDVERESIRKIHADYEQSWDAVWRSATAVNTSLQS